MYHIFAKTPIWRSAPQAPEQFSHGNVLDRGDRPSPKESATLFDEGTERMGQDGNMWKIAVASNGTHRWTKVKKMADGGQAGGGRLCPVGTEIQTLIFDKDKFNQGEAKKWASDHDFKTGVDEKENTYRLRQLDPGHFTKGSFRTISLKSGVKAVIGCPKK